MSVKANKIYLIRQLLNMDSAEFGEELDYGQSTIRHIEQGNRTCTDELCEKVCKCLDVNERWLMDDSNLNKDLEIIFTDLLEDEDGLHPRKQLDPIKQGKRVREIVGESGLSQREFSSVAGFTLSNLQALLNGKKKLTYRNAEKIENAFHVSVDWLLYGDENSKEDPCDKEMIEFLKSNPESRKALKEMMKEILNGESGKKTNNDRDRFLCGKEEKKNN